MLSNCSLNVANFELTDLMQVLQKVILLKGGSPGIFDDLTMFLCI